jgi:hypothetical protein
MSVDVEKDLIKWLTGLKLEDRIFDFLEDKLVSKEPVTRKEWRESYFKKYSEGLSEADKGVLKIWLEHYHPDPEPGTFKHFYENNHKKIPRMICKVAPLILFLL